MYNLIVTAQEGAWGKSIGQYDYGRGRVVHGYTTNVLQEAFKNDLGKLANLPSLFAYEYGTTFPAQIGWITKVEERQSTVRIHYRMEPNFPTISMDRLKELAWELDLGNVELYNTHLAVKDVDLLSVLLNAEIITKEQASVGPAPAASRPYVLHISPQVFRVPDGDPDPTLASVMMPFGKEFTPVYEALKAACTDAGIKLERVDNIWQEDAIIDDIFSLLYRSSYVICDFSGKNPNVFYEAGIAHTLGRPVIPIVQKEDHVPFDLRHRRFQLYENSKDGLVELKGAVTKRLKTLLSNKKR